MGWSPQTYDYQIRKLEDGERLLADSRTFFGYKLSQSFLCSSSSSNNDFAKYFISKIFEILLSV